MRSAHAFAQHAVAVAVAICEARGGKTTHRHGTHGYGSEPSQPVAHLAHRVEVIEAQLDDVWRRRLEARLRPNLCAAAGPVRSFPAACAKPDRRWLDRDCLRTALLPSPPHHKLLAAVRR